MSRLEPLPLLMLSLPFDVLNGPKKISANKKKGIKKINTSSRISSRCRCCCCCHRRFGTLNEPEKDISVNNNKKRNIPVARDTLRLELLLLLLPSLFRRVEWLWVLVEVLLVLMCSRRGRCCCGCGCGCCCGGRCRGCG